MTDATIEVLVTPTIAAGVDLSDPFRYGWRPVRHVRPDGGETWERVPLTLGDVLHPREGDHVTQNEAHARRCVYLYDVFRARVAADPTAVVLHEVLIAWDVPDLKPHGPDIAVIFGVREGKEWGTFNVAIEQVRPDLIVEVTSPETAAVDRLAKYDEYEMAGVPLYAIVDMVPRPRRPWPRVQGFALTPDGYRELALDERGRLWLEPVRLWLGIQEGEIVCYDEADRPLGDYLALTAALATAEQRIDAVQQARAEAEQRAAAADQRATIAETRLQALEAELRRLRGEDE